MDVRKCNTSCRHYLKIPRENGGGALCCYDHPSIKVSIEDSCKYQFVDKATLIECLTPEERLLRDIFQSQTDITMEEALEKRKTNQKTQ